MLPELLLTSGSSWGGGQDGADEFKVVLLPARDLADGDGNLCGQLDVVCEGNVP